MIFAEVLANRTITGGPHPTLSSCRYQGGEFELAQGSRWSYLQRTLEFEHWFFLLIELAQRSRRSYLRRTVELDF